MSGYLNRSVSLMMESVGINSLPSSHNGAGGEPRSMRADAAAASPLKIFVLAKKRINDIFGMIEDYVNESSRFLSSCVKFFS